MLGPRRAPLRVRVLALVAVALAGVSAWVPLSAGDHLQTSGGHTVAFDHRTGNEWWVEVVVSGPDAATVSSVQAMDDGGPWVTLTAHPDWAAGDWAGSFHIEPGHRVLFRALWSDGSSVQSCWFTHPDGVEQCTTSSSSSSTASTSSSTGSAFDASFTGVRGNEWWVQAQVATNGPALGHVDVRLYNGAWGGWMPLQKQSWGWAASYHIVQGTIVQLRATSTAGATDLSSCRQWIPPSGQDAALVTCPGTTVTDPCGAFASCSTTSSSPPPFDATFTGVKGNDWWVQVNVAANQPLKSVAVRVDCVPFWQGLTHQSWGGWTASFNIPRGSKVDFQARSTTGATDVSGGYVWPDATPTAGCPQGDWPRWGSTVAYGLSSGVCGGGECLDSSATLRMTFHDDNSAGAWIGTCTGQDDHYLPDGTHTTETWSNQVGFPPSWLPTKTAVGAQLTPMMFSTWYGQHGCGAGDISSPLTVVRQEDHQVALKDSNGNPLTLHTWYGESTNPDDNLWTAHWDTKMGLVQDLSSNPRMSEQGSASMVLLSTNAPYP